MRDEAEKRIAKLGAKAEVARELAYRLYTLCERKKRAAEALAYNGLVQSWPEIARRAREGGKPRTEQGELFECVAMVALRRTQVLKNVSLTEGHIRSSVAA